jgi:hypothetical protein
LLVKEALDVLALRPGATLAEIKDAYRDLVKVWHPDRFGSDARLRQKAEDKLKEINKAYLVLQSDRGGGSAVEPDGFAASSTGGGAASPRGFWSAVTPRTGLAGAVRSSVGVGWIYGCVGMALGLIAGYVALEHGALQGVRSTPATSVQQVEASSELIVPKIPSAQTPGGGLVEHDVNSAGLTGRSVQPKDSGRSNRSSSAQFRVRQLSGAETDQLESACSALKGTAAYRACVKAQLDMITKAPGQPDLSALNAAERESIESACSEAKRLHGTEGFNRCLTAQMAEFAADPARPDLLGLNEADRSSIEAACRKAKYRDGPSAYNRCRAGLIKLLAEAK